MYTAFFYRFIAGVQADDETGRRQRITPEELDRLYWRAPAFVSAWIKRLSALNTAINKAPRPLVELTRWQKGLQNGNVQHQGLEMFAGASAYEANIRFAGYLRSIDEELQERILSLIGPTGKTIEAIWRLFSVVESANRGEVQFCVHIQGNSVAGIIDRNKTTLEAMGVQSSGIDVSKERASLAELEGMWKQDSLEKAGVPCAVAGTPLDLAQFGALVDECIQSFAGLIDDDENPLAGRDFRGSSFDLERILTRVQKVICDYESHAYLLDADKVNDAITLMSTIISIALEKSRAMRLKPAFGSDADVESLVSSENNFFKYAHDLLVVSHEFGVLSKAIQRIKKEGFLVADRVLSSMQGEIEGMVSGFIHDFDRIKGAKQFDDLFALAREIDRLNVGADADDSKSYARDMSLLVLRSTIANPVARIRLHTRSLSELGKLQDDSFESEVDMDHYWADLGRCLEDNHHCYPELADECMRALRESNRELDVVISLSDRRPELIGHFYNVNCLEEALPLLIESLVKKDVLKASGRSMVRLLHFADKNGMKQRAINEIKECVQIPTSLSNLEIYLSLLEPGEVVEHWRTILELVFEKACLFIPALSKSEDESDNCVFSGGSKSINLLFDLQSNVCKNDQLGFLDRLANVVFRVDHQSSVKHARGQIDLMQESLDKSLDFGRLECDQLFEGHVSGLAGLQSSLAEKIIIFIDSRDEVYAKKCLDLMLSISAITKQPAAPIIGKVCAAHDALPASFSSCFDSMVKTLLINNFKTLGSAIKEVNNSDKDDLLVRIEDL